MRSPVFVGLWILVFIAAAVLVFANIEGWVDENTGFDTLDAIAGDAQEEAQEEVDALVDELNATPEPTETPAPVVFGDQFPEVLSVDVELINNDNWRFSVTLSSPYDTPERYADAWRVLDDKGKELGIRELAHDHANEQPFTRSQEIRVPRRVDIVYIEGRDQANGWSGQRFEVAMP